MTTTLQHLKAEIIDDVAVAVRLEVTNPAWMRGQLTFLGASMPASASPGEQVTSFTLHPKKGENGIFAVTILEDHKANDKKWGFLTMHRESYFLEVKWEDGRPFAHIEKPFFPTKGIGQITSSSEIEVALPNGVRVGTSAGSTTKGYADANLLCRYLYGTARTHEVLHAVVQHKLEPTRAKIIERLDVELWKAKNQLHTAENRKNESFLYYQMAQREVEKLKSEIASSKQTLFDVTGYGTKWVVYATQINRRLDIALEMLQSIPGWLRKYLGINLERLGDRPQVPKPSGSNS